MQNYPSPRYPRFKKPGSVEELLPKARELVGTPPGQPFYAFKPSYNIRKGDKILFVVLSEYHPMIVEAMHMALKEKGAIVDLLILDSTPLEEPRNLAKHELLSIGTEEGDYSYYYTVITDLLRRETANAMKKAEKYTMIIAGAAGPQPPVSYPWHRFNCNSLEDFVGPAVDTPVELLELINRKLFAQIAASRTMSLIDPEGTDVHWTNYDDERIYAPSHMFARPYNIGHGFGGKDDCSGVIAGTICHLGAFPHCRVQVEGGQVIKVEGGGSYGDCWREKLEWLKDRRLPQMYVLGSATKKFQISDPGYFWYNEGAIGTVPGMCRTEREGMFQNYANCLHERIRAGYYHSGFGDWADFRSLLDAGFPWSHCHIHSLFATLTGTSEKGRPTPIIDRGHLTALDDPDVRRLAETYGDPDELLNEIWIPAVPGINVQGDYMRDYGQDPVDWIMKETREHPIWGP
jgi:hypothetical protein